jgi:ArsR family transcriptional regulator
MTTSSCVKFFWYVDEMPAQTPLERATPLVQSPLGPKGLASLEVVLKAIAHRHRLVILHELSHEKNVAAGAFAEMLGLSQARTSYHLQQLLNAGLIMRQRQGRWMTYRLVDGALDRLTALVAGSAELDAARATTYARTLFPESRGGRLGAPPSDRKRLD